MKTKALVALAVGMLVVGGCTDAGDPVLPESSVVTLTVTATVSLITAYSGGPPPTDIEVGDPVEIVLSFLPGEAYPPTREGIRTVGFPVESIASVVVTVGDHVWTTSMKTFQVLNDEYDELDMIEVYYGRKVGDLMVGNLLLYDHVAPLDFLAGDHLPRCSDELDPSSITGGRGHIATRPESGAWWGVSFATGRG
jgi:hypothetical protein